MFLPDPRSRTRQKYCHKPECRDASKEASQRRWLSKPVKRGYFSGSENVRRVQLWREANPGYWRRTRKVNKDALQDPSNTQPNEKIGIIPNCRIPIIISQRSAGRKWPPATRYSHPHPHRQTAGCGHSGYLCRSKFAGPEQRPPGLRRHPH